MSEYAGPGSRATELRRALEDERLRASLAVEEKLLENAAEEVLRWLNLGTDGKPLATGDENFSDPASCGGYLAAEELALILAIGAKSDAGFQKWSKAAEGYALSYELCTVLASAP